MRLADYIEEHKPDEAAERRRLAERKDYRVLEYVDEVADRIRYATRDDTVVGSTAPEIFVGRSNYPEVSTGILTPVGAEDRAGEFETDAGWYNRGLDIESVLQYRSGLLNSSRTTRSNVHDVWNGFVGVQREVAIADRPVDVEVGLAERPDPDLSLDAVRSPTGPRAPAEEAALTENPHVPRHVEKTLSDDDWNAEGAMAYLYRRGFDVYGINSILSAGALGRRDQRRLVPTRWSITAVDDTLGQYLRGRIRNAPSIEEVQVWVNEYVGNRYWVVLAPGRWEYEFLEMKSPGSVWNPDPAGNLWMASAHEGYEGRSEYVEETAGAYYAARLAALEELSDRGRQAKVFVVRHATDEYWAPVGIWQLREAVRGALDAEPAVAESFHDAVRQLEPRLPVSTADLRRKSTMVAGVQADLSAFGAGAGR